MRWIGKIIGGAFGYSVAGPLGFVLGVFFGHSIDQTLSGKVSLKENWNNLYDKQTSQQYLLALFSALGSIAKADGRVSETEIHYARSVMTDMGLDEKGVAQAIHYFNEGKTSFAKARELMQTLQKQIPGNHVLSQTLFEILLNMAYVDGPMLPTSRHILFEFSKILGISQIQFERFDAIMRMRYSYTHSQHNTHQGYSYSSSSNSYTHAGKRNATMSLSAAYAMLEVSANASDADIKKAYRRLMSRHHPDKLIAQGVSQEMIKLATAKAQQVKEAYDIIKHSRGISS